MAVGGIGMVCTANYNARKFGIRAAMPGFIARKLCPDLVFVKPDFQKYTKASQATRAVFRDFDPEFEAGSLDEAYLDLTAYCEQYGMTGSNHAEHAQWHTGCSLKSLHAASMLLCLLTANMQRIQTMCATFHAAQCTDSAQFVSAIGTVQLSQDICTVQLHKGTMSNPMQMPYCCLWCGLSSLFSS